MSKLVEDGSLIIYREFKVPVSLDFKVYLFCLKTKSLLYVLGIIILDFLEITCLLKANINVYITSRK
jgi:hypothetical protein